MIEPSIEPTNNIDDINAENLVSETTDLQPENTAMESPEVIEPTETTQSSENLTEEKMTEIKKEEINPESSDIEEIEEMEDEVAIPQFDEDFTNYSKKDYVDLADKMLDSMESRSLTVSDVKNIDNVLKVIRTAFDEISIEEKSVAKKEYIEQNGSDEGFEFKNDSNSIRFEGILIRVREKRHEFFQKLEREKEDYFEIKTRLLQTLREIVETEEKGESKNNWEAFKKLQTEWKNAGNVNSPHNGTLWSAYNALIDRYFDIRSIQNELKDLDRKKNLIHKEGVVIKIEAIAESLKEDQLTNIVLKKANELLLEYKQIGPGPREEQEALWSRLKSAFDVIYEKKRELAKENSSLNEEIFNAKNQILLNLKPYLEFQSDSINEWNAKTKEVMEIQDQWNAIKGAMPRDKGKELSKDFWHSLKQFFKNKSEFFAKLEAKRESNYKGKEELCIAADEILASGDHSAPNTNKIIELQKKWKTIGHVPEKYKDSLYNRFKAACDQYFDLKRSETKTQDAEFEANLAKKVAICDELEKLAKSGSSELSKLSDYKKDFAAIGFVPRKDMQNIQTRFIKAINDFVKTSSGLDKTEKDKLMLQNEAEVVFKSGGNSRNLDKQENEIRRKMKSLEEEITLTRNNMEFFGHSKNAEKLKEEYMKKVVKAEKELKDLQDKLRLINAAH
ncbi:DUF349 domain-containing protein [Lacihabitans sp. LS3-19]|uniref:DUF349 domain-containing protein n=1 Tax=Lacihabitans sp. LS3-19 TaxID=2487335 RepID=UPI0020CBF639|nr:DUF349 domain-containing protein [Lacihabitans sp. LS3-19]